MILVKVYFFRSILNYLFSFKLYNSIWSLVFPKAKYLLSEDKAILYTKPSCLIVSLTYLVLVSHILINLSEDAEATIAPSEEITIESINS